MDLKNINLDLKNIDLESIKAKIKSIDKKILIKFGIGFLSIIIFLIIYYAVLSPIVEKKKAQLDNMQKKQAEIIKMNQDIKSSKAKIKKLTPRYEQYSTLFHSKAEVEGLYDTLSQFAGINNLVISKIEKGKPKAITKASAIASTEKKKKKKKRKSRKKVDTGVKKNIAYYRIPVNFQIKGNFLGYIKFKRQVAMSQKMLNFDKETIKVIKGDTTSTVAVTGVLTIVGLPDEFF
jgi:Tfp pilus assembly protein PilO|tara:strand:+ start:678 stop:1379 length:702 start_codon:yes stop_codon:yes gene_type:complete